MSGCGCKNNQQQSQQQVQQQVQQIAKQQIQQKSTNDNQQLVKEALEKYYQKK